MSDGMVLYKGDRGWHKYCPFPYEYDDDGNKQLGNGAVWECDCGKMWRFKPSFWGDMIWKRIRKQSKRDRIWRRAMAEL